MRRRSLLLLCALALACSAADKQPTEPPAPTFAISGTVHDREGRRLNGANADVFGTLSNGRHSITNSDGFFSLKVVGGPATLRVWKEGYEAYFLPLVVTGDTAFDVTLPRFEFADTLILGQTVRSYVAATAAPCDPVHWDALAPCRLIHFFAPASGKLAITVTWRGEPPLDVTVVAYEGQYIATSGEYVAEQAYVEATVAAGTLYEIRINSYYDYQEFDLRADLIAASARSYGAPRQITRRP